MKNKFIAFLFSFLFTVCTFAAVEEPDAPPPPPVACDLTFATGADKKGYNRIGKNIKEVCPAIPVCITNTTGGLQNLGLAAAKKADVFLVQADTLTQMMASDESYKGFQVVANLNGNMMHIFTLEKGFNIASTAETKKMWGMYTSKDSTVLHIDVTKFSELKGKRVGLVGSAQLLVRKLNDVIGHSMQFTNYDTDAAGIAAMNKGEVFAVFSLEAWPHSYVETLKANSGLKLVNYDLQPMAPYTVSKKNYPVLDQYGVPFLTANNLLVTRPFTFNGPNHKNVSDLKSCIVRNLGKLRDGKFEPGWSDVNNIEETFGLPKFNSATGGVSVKKK